MIKTKTEQSVEFEISERVLLIKINGELDHHASIYVREADEIICRERIINIIFNFENTSFMDSSGIGVIMGRYKRIRDFGGKIGVINVSDNVEKILMFSGLNKIVNHYSNIEEGINDMRGGII